jgi:predicted AAA+ superfamily ATPase
MFEDVIIEQNKHWDGTLYDPGVHRDCFPLLLEYLTTGMIVSVTGVRRAGKSTLLKQLINYLITQKKIAPTNILFLNLEHPYFSAYSKEIENLQKIYEEYLKIAEPKGTVYLLLDEIQFFTGWPIFVKSLFEQKRVRFIITGSNSALISSDLVTLLSGRTLPIELFPLSFAELVRTYNLDISGPIKFSRNRIKLKKILDEQLQFGGFPDVVLHLNPAVAYDILNAYAKTILYQDVAPRLQIRKSVELERLFVYLVSNIGKPFSYTNLSKLFDITDKVIKEYIAAFCDSYLLFELEVFDFSLKKQIRNPKKVYSIDTGQINAIAFHFTQNRGRLLENLVLLELKRLDVELYYYKTDQDLEIDFLAKKQRKIALIQVAWDVKNMQTLEREQTALLKGLDELKLSNGCIITYDHEEEIMQDDKKIILVPAYKFFSLSVAKKLELLAL